MAKPILVVKIPFDENQPEVLGWMNVDSTMEEYRGLMHDVYFIR